MRFYRDFLGLDVLKTSKRTLVVRLGPKRMLTHLNSVAEIDIIETNTEIRHHKMHNHIGFTAIHKVNGRHGSYGFNSSVFGNNARQIEHYPRGGHSRMFEQGGDLENPFQSNLASVEDWHEPIDPETYSFRGLMEG